jgi:hypothetical protein
VAFDYRCLLTFVGSRHDRRFSFTSVECSRALLHFASTPSRDKRSLKIESGEELGVDCGKTKNYLAPIDLDLKCYGEVILSQWLIPPFSVGAPGMAGQDARSVGSWEWIHEGPSGAGSCLDIARGLGHVYLHWSRQWHTNRTQRGGDGEFDKRDPRRLLVLGRFDDERCTSGCLQEHICHVTDGGVARSQCHSVVRRRSKHLCVPYGMVVAYGLVLGADAPAAMSVVASSERPSRAPRYFL